MKEFKGTKGKWKVAECVTNGTKGYEIHWSEDGECVTDHVYDLHDAKLIASAPEILKRSIELLDYIIKDQMYSENNPNIKPLIKAINKAL